MKNQETELTNLRQQKANLLQELEKYQSSDTNHFLKNIKEISELNAKILSSIMTFRHIAAEEAILLKRIPSQ